MTTLAASPEALAQQASRRMRSNTCRQGNLRAGQALALQHRVDQREAFFQSVERHEGAHARALFLAQQDLVERLEPVAQVLVAVVLADGIDLVLDRHAVRVGGQRPQAPRKVRQRLALFLARRICKDASLIFAGTNQKVHRMIQRRRVDFVYFATVDEALEHCENALLELRLEKSQHVSTDALRAVDVDDANLPPPPFLGRQQSLDFRAPDESGGNPKSEVVPSVVHSNPEVSLCILAEEHSLALPPLSDDSRAVPSAVIMSDAVAGMAVYPPEEVQRRAARNPDGHIRLRQRFTRHVESAYGIADLWPIVRYCDVVVCVPGSVIYDESDNELPRLPP